MDRYLIVLCGIFTACIGMAYADSFESVNKIKEVSKQFITQAISLAPDETMDITINPSDLPNQLAACTKDIEVALPNESSREKINSVELTCNGEKTWHVFVPINVQFFTKVVVATRSIAPNEMISATDLEYANYNAAHLYNGYFKDKKEASGYIASQTIGAGSVINKRNIKRPQLVHRNQIIDLVARKNAIVVTMKGIAKSDGVLNDTIIAYNPSSKKTVEAVVIGVNKAEVVSS